MTGLLLILSLLATPPPPAVVELMSAIEGAVTAGEPAQALAAVERFEGPAHPLVDLARGHALSLADRSPEAVDAYRAALKVDPTLREAGLGLVGALARSERWTELCAELPRWAALDEADLRTLRVWLSAALGADDAILAEEITRRGLVRFPGDPALRRGLAYALLATGRPRPAAAILRRLIEGAPGDAELWQRLAAADPAVRRPALQAALLAAPADQTVRARLVGELLAAGHGPAALRHAAPLADSPAHRLLAVRAAMAAESWDRAHRWLVSAERSDPTVRRLMARIALARGDRRTARAELAALVAAGEPGVRLQLAALEREAGRLDRAEALLRQASAADRPGPAPLHLAHLLLRRGRRAEAVGILRRHLARAPGDGAARALLDAVE